MCALEADLASVDQTFGGTFKAPNLLNDKDGIATERYPADNDEIWELSPTLLARSNMVKQTCPFGAHCLKS